MKHHHMDLNQKKDFIFFYSTVALNKKTNRRDNKELLPIFRDNRKAVGSFKV